jgi:hypothetical protein
MATVKTGHHPVENKRSYITGMLLLVILGAGIGGFFLVRSLYRSHVLSSFEYSVMEYVAMRPMGTPVEQPSKGGIIPIDVASNTIDDFYFDLPDSLKAASPETVKTVVFLRWDREKTHQYVNGKPGYTMICEVELVDRETKQYLKKFVCKGPPPPESIRGRSSSGEGSRPTEQIIQFLKNSTAIK